MTFSIFSCIMAKEKKKGTIKMAEKIKITADSTCDLSKELVEKYNIEIVPLGIYLGDDLFTDGVNITPQQIFDYVDKTKILPKTSAVTIYEYTEIFKKYVDDGYTVIHVNISSSMSSSYSNAVKAAEEVGNVYVVDSANLSTGSGHVVLELADMIAEGKTAKEAVEEIKNIIPKVNASFILGNLDYMKKGGRCSGVAVLGANLLKLKISIEVKDGAMQPGKKYRGPLANVLKEYAEDRLNSVDMKIRKKRVFVTHTCMEDTLPNMIRDFLVEKNYFDEVIITSAGSTVLSHCGKDTLGVLFIEE